MFGAKEKEKRGVSTLFFLLDRPDQELANETSHATPDQFNTTPQPSKTSDVSRAQAPVPITRPNRVTTQTPLAKSPLSQPRKVTKHNSPSGSQILFPSSSKLVNLACNELAATTSPVDGSNSTFEYDRPRGTEREGSGPSSWKLGTHSRRHGPCKIAMAE